MSVPMNKSGFAPHAGVEYLAQRGITVEMAKQSGIEFVTHKEANDYLKTPANKRSYKGERDALWIPAFQPDGSRHPYQGQAIFFVAQKPAIKIAFKNSHEQPNDVSCMPLRSPYKLLPTPVKIVITESAIKGCIVTQLLDMPAIAGNGVGGWSKGNAQLANGYDGLPGGATFIIAFDSLNTSKRQSFLNVLGMRDLLAHKLQEKYPECHVQYIELPPPPIEWSKANLKDGKPKMDWGIDDYYVHWGLEKTRALFGPDSLKTYKQLSAKAVLLAWMNTKFIFLKNDASVYDIEAGVRKHWEIVAKQLAPYKFAVDKKMFSLASAWLEWPGRREADGLSFKPGEDLDTSDGKVNIWTGFGVTPDFSEAALAEAKKYWVDTLYESYGPSARLLIEVLACRVQHPERRLSRFIVSDGPHGTGKNFSVEPMQRILGQHARSMSIENFSNKYNASRLGCHLGIINETPPKSELHRGVPAAVWSITKEDADSSRTTMQLEPKHTDVQTVERNQLNWFLGNYGPPFDIEHGERRGIFLWAGGHMASTESSKPGLKPPSYWTERWDWLNYSNGAAAVLGWLLKYDISGVDFVGAPERHPHKDRLMGMRARTTESFIFDFGQHAEAMMTDALDQEVLLELALNAKPLKAQLEKALAALPTEGPEEELKASKAAALSYVLSQAEFVIQARTLVPLFANSGEAVGNPDAIVRAFGKTTWTAWEVEPTRKSSAATEAAGSRSIRGYGLKGWRVVPLDSLQPNPERTKEEGGSSYSGLELINAEDRLYRALANTKW